MAQYRGARNQKPGGRNLCGGMVQLHPGHIMVGVVLHAPSEDGHSRRTVASPPSSRPPSSPHRPSPVSISIAASRRRASPDRSPTMARRTPEGIPAPPRAPEAPSSARVEVPNVLRALLRAHRLLAAKIFRVRSGSGALQPTFRARELKERRARPRRAAVMYAMAGGAGRSCRS